MEKLVLDLNSKDQLVSYLKENRLIRYEPGILNEMLAAVEHGQHKLICWFNQFGDSIRSIIMNVHAYRKGLEFGFTEIALDRNGWFIRPEFLCNEGLRFGNEFKYGEYSTLKIAKGMNGVWTYALSYNFGTAGGGSGISVYGKQFKSREAAVNAGLAELRSMMVEKINHTDTSNYKQPIIQATLKAIAKYEIDRVQLSLF